MRIPPDKPLPAPQILIERRSIRTVNGITDVHLDTIMRFLAHAGKNCA